MAFSYNQPDQQEEQVSTPKRGRRGFSFTPKLIFLALFVIVVIITLSTGFFVVDQTEQAVILRLGKYLKTVGPGLQFKIPFGIDTSYNVETQTVQTMSFGYRTSTTGNGKPATILSETSENIMKVRINVLNGSVKPSRLFPN